MGLKRFKKIQINDPEAKQIQQNIEEAVNPIINSPIIDGVLLKNINLTASEPNLVEHKLGRKSLGFIIVRQRSDSRIWDIQDSNNLTSTTIALACSHNVEVDIWVF